MLQTVQRSPVHEGRLLDDSGNPRNVPAHRAEVVVFQDTRKIILLLSHMACNLTVIWNMYPPETPSRRMKEKFLKQKATLATVVFRKVLIYVTPEK